MSVLPNDCDVRRIGGRWYVYSGDRQLTQGFVERYDAIKWVWMGTTERPYTSKMICEKDRHDYDAYR